MSKKNEINDPFQQPVVGKDFDISADVIPDSVPSPTIDRKIVIEDPDDSNVLDIDETKETKKSSPPPKKEKTIFGDIVDAKDTKKAAKTIVSMYCQVTEQLPLQFFAKGSEYYELKSMMGEFDRNILFMNIPLGDGNLMLKDFLDQQASQLSTALITPQERKEMITEALIEVMKEKGVSLTPTQNLMLNLGYDILMKGIAIYNIASTNSTILKVCKNMYMENNFNKQEIQQNIIKSEQDNSNKQNDEYNPPVEVAQAQAKTKTDKPKPKKDKQRGKWVRPKGLKYKPRKPKVKLNVEQEINDIQ